MDKFSNLRQWISRQPLAITSEGLSLVMGILEAHEAGGTGNLGLAAEIRAQRQAAIGQARARAGGKTAVIPLHGVISSRAGSMEQQSGIVSPQEFASMVSDAAADPLISSILLHIDSPGGTAAGTPEAARAVANAKLSKPVVAYVDGYGASAAYWIASQASRIVATPEAQLGSIGVIASHTDATVKAEKQGVKVTYFRSTPGKAQGQQYEPLTDEVRAEIQADVDGFYNQFVDSVATGRGINPELLRGWNNAQVLFGSDAVANGLADRVGTFDDALAELQTLQTQPQTFPMAAVNQPMPKAALGDVRLVAGLFNGLTDPTITQSSAATQVLATLGKPSAAPTGRLPQGSIKGDVMVELLAALGVSTEAEALEAVAALRQTAGEAVAQIEGLTAKVTTLEGSIAALSEQAKLDAQAALEARVDAAIKAAESKVPPSARASLREAGLRDEEWLTNHLAALPSVGVLSNQFEPAGQETKAPVTPRGFIRQALTAMKGEGGK
jgi:capsid assembly protease